MQAIFNWPAVARTQLSTVEGILGGRLQLQCQAALGLPGMLPGACRSSPQKMTLPSNKIITRLQRGATTVPEARAHLLRAGVNKALLQCPSTRARCPAPSLCHTSATSAPPGASQAVDAALVVVPHPQCSQRGCPIQGHCDSVQCARRERSQPNVGIITSHAHACRMQTHTLTCIAFDHLRTGPKTTE